MFAHLPLANSAFKTLDRKIKDPISNEVEVKQTPTHTAARATKTSNAKPSSAFRLSSDFNPTFLIGR